MNSPCRTCVRARALRDHFKRFNRISCVEWIARHTSPSTTSPTVCTLVVHKMRFTAFEIELKSSEEREREMQRTKRELYFWWDVCSMHCMPYTCLVAFHFQWCVVKTGEDAMDQSFSLNIVSRISLHLKAWMKNKKKIPNYHFSECNWQCDD